MKEIIFGINSTSSQEATGLANDRFMGRSIRSLLPNSYDPNLNTGNLIKRCIQNHEKRITKKNKTNKILYDIGARVRLQDVATKEFKLFGKITSLRVADNGAVVSYGIATDRGYTTTRHRRFLRPLAAEHYPQIIKQKKNISKSNTLGKTDIAEQGVEKSQAGCRQRET